MLRRNSETERKRERERESMCVYVSYKSERQNGELTNHEDAVWFGLNVFSEDIMGLVQHLKHCSFFFFFFFFFGGVVLSLI